MVWHGIIFTPFTAERQPRLCVMGYENHNVTGQAGIIRALSLKRHAVPKLVVTSFDGSTVGISRFSRMVYGRRRRGQSVAVLGQIPNETPHLSQRRRSCEPDAQASAL
jgi:hypothetical protein